MAVTDLLSQRRLKNGDGREDLYGKMNSEDFVVAAERDALLADVMKSVELALSLTNGMSVTSGTFRGTLHFDHHIARLRAALQLLGVDESELLENHTDV